MIISATGQATQPAEIDVSDLLGALLEALGPRGVAVLLAVGAVLLLRRKACRKAVGKAVGRAARAVLLHLRLTLWAAYLRMPVRLAYRLQPDRWREMCAARKLTGLKRGKVRRTPMGVDILVTLGGSLTLESLTARIPDLETGLGTRRGAIRVEGRDSAHKALVRITVRDPLRRPVKWEQPTGPVSITQPARLSMSPFGDWTEIDLRQRILVVGASGSGKSSVQRVLAAPVVLADDADLEVWDLKQGTESQHYAGRADVRVTTADQCRARIAHLLDVELPRRAAIMQRLRTSTWPTSPEYPDRIVMVDEGAALIRALSDEDLGRLYTLIEQARAYGVYLWWATQFPKSDNLPTQVRSQMSAVVALKMRRASESRVVFEDGVREGWTPHRLRGAGWLLLADDDHPDPEETRAAWLPEQAFRRLERPAARVTVEQEPTVPPMPDYAPAVPPPAAVEQAPAALPDAVLAALDNAPPGGMSAAALQVATGRGRSQVYAALQDLQDAGRVVRVAHGRYALAAEQSGEVSA